MIVSVRDAVCIASIAGLCAIGGIRWCGAISAVEPTPATIPSIRATWPLPDSLLEVAEQRLVDNDPFRLANEPASVRYDPGTEGGMTPAPTMIAPRPALALKAIVGGPPWEAIIDGIPGQPAGTSVRAGAKFDKLVARSVTRDSVVIQGPDTTWVLSFRRMP